MSGGGEGVQNKPYDKIALVLQGGGARGSYQSGVYQALCEAGYQPDWISGTSIGAINGAIIASSEREESHQKLDYFWNTVSQEDLFHKELVKGPNHKWVNYSNELRALLFGNPSMFVPRALSTLYLQNDPEKISFYDPQPLKKLLQKLINFDRLNSSDNTRLTIDAVNVTTGKATYFDNRFMPLLLDHIMASAALAPAMPAVRIGNNLYWDGGLLSNTPLGAILDETPRHNILCFMVDLFNPDGPEPGSLDKVEMRIKELHYSSASDTHIAYSRVAHNLRRALHQVVAMLPEEERNNITTETFRNLGNDTTMHIVHLIYRPKAYEWDIKDYNFSSQAISKHYHEGYLDVCWALKHSSWLEEVPPDAGVIVHRVTRGEEPVTLF